MSAFLLLSALAFAESPEPTFERLFEEAPIAADAAGGAVEPGTPSAGWAWPALLSGAGLVAAWQLRKRAGMSAKDGMRIVSRQALGDRTSLALVEVPDGQGGMRRLLVGSCQGSITLLNDLGLVTPEAQPVTAASLVQSDDFEFGFEPDSPSIQEAMNEPERAAAPVDEFAQMLEEVLEERGAGSGLEPKVEPRNEPLAAPVAQALPYWEPAESPGRYFAESDLAPPPPEPVEVRPSRIHRGYLTVRDPEEPDGVTLVPAAPPRLMAPPMRTMAAPRNVARPPPAPARAAPSRAAPPPVPTAPYRSGIAALVKGRLPAPTARNVDELPVERTRVGPTLRDPRLTLPNAIPALRLATPKGAPVVQEPIPTVDELVDRLRARHTEPQKLVANGGVWGFRERRT